MTYCRGQRFSELDNGDLLKGQDDFSPTHRIGGGTLEQDTSMTDQEIRKNNLFSLLSSNHTTAG